MQAHISVKARFADEYERPQLRRGRHTPFPRRVSAQAKVRIMFRAGLVDIRHNARDRRVPATFRKYRVAGDSSWKTHPSPDESLCKRKSE